MKNFSAQLIETLTARNEAKASADLVTSINNAKTHSKALDQLFGTKAFDPISKKLLASLSIASPDQNREDFIAVKVAVKIISTANAIAQGDKQLLDPYSRTILENLAKLQQLSNKGALVSLSKAIVYTDDEQKANLTSRYQCSAGTAGTQASSTRMMLRALDVCEVLKSKRGDSITVKANERAEALLAMITGKAAPAPAVVAEEKPVKAAAAPKKAAAAKPATAAKKPAAKTTAAKPAAAKKPTSKKGAAATA